MDLYGKRVAEKWNELSADFDERHATEDLEKWKEVLKELIGKDAGADVLDVGTGTGFLALMLAELGYKSHGIDFAEGMLVIASQHAAKRGVQVGFQLGEAENLPYPNEMFDVVVNSRVLWTLLYPERAFQEWKRVLKPGGMVLSFTRIQDKTAEASTSVYDDETEGKLPLRYASEAELVKAFTDSGFQQAEAILLPKEVTFKEDLKPWLAIKGIK